MKNGFKSLAKKYISSSELLQRLYYSYCYKKWYVRKNPMRHDKIEKFAEHGIVYVLAPAYSNLGDVAIFVHSLEFLRKNARQPIKAVLYSRQCVNRKNITSLPLYDDDEIVIQGGGNMGALYPLEELLRQNIVSWFPHNRIVSLPQSVCFENSRADFILKRAKKIYSAHKNLTICARDVPSLDFCRGNFACDVILAPDMVLSAVPRRITGYTKNRKVLLCLRKDKESRLHGDNSFIEALLAKSGFSFEYWDTDDLSGRNIDNKEQKINEVLAYFNSFHFVITDRYHGTILSYISKTPCIGLDNSYGKVKNGFVWFKDCNYMFFANEESELQGFIERAANLAEFSINPSLEDSFSGLKERLIQKDVRS